MASRTTRYDRRSTMQLSVVTPVPLVAELDRLAAAQAVSRGEVLRRLITAGLASEERQEVTASA